MKQASYWSPGLESGALLVKHQLVIEINYVLKCLINPNIKKKFTYKLGYRFNWEDKIVSRIHKLGNLQFGFNYNSTLLHGLLVHIVCSHTTLSG